MNLERMLEKCRAGQWSVSDLDWSVPPRHLEPDAEQAVVQYFTDMAGIERLAGALFHLQSQKVRDPILQEILGTLGGLSNLLQGNPSPIRVTPSADFLKPGALQLLGPRIDPESLHGSPLGPSVQIYPHNSLVTALYTLLLLVGSFLDFLLHIAGLDGCQHAPCLTHILQIALRFFF